MKLIRMEERKESERIDLKVEFKWAYDIINTCKTKSNKDEIFNILADFKKAVKEFEDICKWESVIEERNDKYSLTPAFLERKHVAYESIIIIMSNLLIKSFNYYGDLEYIVSCMSNDEYYYFSVINDQEYSKSLLKKSIDFSIERCKVRKVHRMSNYKYLV